jgi:bifunctional non-homologous end joining protein LigD
MFYQRTVGTGLGPDVKAFKWKHKGKMHEYFYTESRAGLLQMVQMGTVEFHPWGTRHDNMDCPDWAIFDLDPDSAVPFEAVKLAALDLKQRLQGKGLACFLRCTGGKGLHVIVPLAGKDPWTDVIMVRRRCARDGQGCSKCLHRHHDEGGAKGKDLRGFLPQ